LLLGAKWLMASTSASVAPRLEAGTRAGGFGPMDANNRVSLNQFGPEVLGARLRNRLRMERAASTTRTKT